MSEFLCAVFQVLVKGNIGVVDVPYYEFVEIGRASCRERVCLYV